MAPVTMNRPEKKINKAQSISMNTRRGLRRRVISSSAAAASAANGMGRPATKAASISPAASMLLRSSGR